MWDEGYFSYIYPLRRVFNWCGVQSPPLAIVWVLTDPSSEILDHILLAAVVEHTFSTLGLGQVRAATPMAAVSIALGEVAPHSVMHGVRLLLRLGTPQLFSVGAVGAITGCAEVTHGCHLCKGFHHRVAVASQALAGHHRAPACG